MVGREGIASFFILPLDIIYGGEIVKTARLDLKKSKIALFEASKSSIKV